MAGVRCAWVASVGEETSSAPVERACTAANRFIVDETGPGSQTRERGSIPRIDEMCANEDTHESVVRTTDRGAPVLPEVRRETGRPAVCASRKAATGSVAAST